MVKEEQLTFPWPVEVSTGYPPGFSHWLRSNRHIYEAFTDRALKMRRTGRQRYSAQTLVEVIRWHSDLRSSDSLFKINNNMVPGLARMAMADHPELQGFFETRERQ